MAVTLLDVGVVDEPVLRTPGMLRDLMSQYHYYSVLAVILAYTLHAAST